MKPKTLTVIDTKEDVVNINLGINIPFHIPYHSLRHYYEGGLHRPPGYVGQGGGNSGRSGHEIYSIVGMLGEQEDLEGTWFSDGVWINGRQHECRDILGAHIRGEQDQEFMICAVESLNGNRPTPTMVRNFTEMTDYKMPIVGHAQVARAHHWKDTIGANLPGVEHSFSDHPDSKNIIYVGSGPSLRRNYEELLKLDYSKAQVWAANEAFQFLSKRGVHVDCFFCIDATSNSKWWDGVDCSETCLVSSPFVNPDILSANWKKVYWFNIAGDGYFYNMIRKARPHLMEIDATKGVGSAMIEASWFKGVKSLALVGCDFCYDFDKEAKSVWRSVDWCLNEQEWKAFSTGYLHYVVKDMNGRNSMSYIGLALEAGAVFGAAQCLWEKGVKVYNATEGGGLFPNKSADYLAKHQEKMGSNVLEMSSLREVIKTMNGS